MALDYGRIGHYGTLEKALAAHDSIPAEGNLQFV